MWDGLQGLDVIRDSGVIAPRAGLKDWVITLRSQRGHSLKLEAHDDGYANQSYIRMSLWSDDKGWLPLVSRRGDELSMNVPSSRWGAVWGGDIEDVTLEGCTLLGLME